MKTISKFLAVCAIIAAVVGCNKPEPDGPQKPVPTISSITPDNGLEGDPVIIKGSNFSSTSSENIVKFGEAQAQVLKASETQLTAYVPAGNPGEVDVTVTVDEQTSKPVKFTYNEPLKPITISSMTPNKTGVGETVTIVGQNFGTIVSNIKVVFGSVEAEIKSLTDTKIEVVVPEGSGEVAVTVQLGEQTPVPAGIFTYVFLREVKITGLSKYTVTAGEELEILCSGFSEKESENKVLIGETQLEILALTATGIRVKVPALEMKDYVAVVQTVSAAPAAAPAFRYYSLPSSYTVSTIIGDGVAANLEGVGTAARVQLPEYVGFAPDGYLWIITRGGENAHGIFRANPTNWELSTVIAPATVGTKVYYWGGDFNSNGEFHACAKGKNYLGKVVKKVVEGETSYELSTYTLTGTTLNNPMNLIFNDSNHMFISDRNSCRIVQGYNGEFEKEYLLGNVQPYTIAFADTQEKLLIGTNGAYVMGMLNLADGKLTQLCGTGVKPLTTNYTDGDEGSLTATIGSISSLVMDANKYIWFNDVTSHTVRVLVPGPADDYTKGIVKTIAGTPCSNGFQDGDGAQAKFKNLGMLTMDKDGNLIVADGNNNRIRKITMTK